MTSRSIGCSAVYGIPFPSDSSALARYRWEHIDFHGSGEPSDEGTVVKRIKGDGREEEIEIGAGLIPIRVKSDFTKRSGSEL